MNKLVASLGIVLLAGVVRLVAQPDYGDRDFRAADSVATLYSGHSLGDIQLLAHKLTAPFSDEADKFRAIYRWVCLNISQDYRLFIKNKVMREKLANNPTALAEWNKKFAALVFKKLVRQQKTLCTGYAYLVRELCFHADLDCRMVDGYGRTANSNIGGSGTINHSWNAVKLNGKWYLCDATWSSGKVDARTNVFERGYDDSYFLSSPAQFVQNHYPLDTALMFLSEKPTLHYFLSAPLVYAAAYRYGVRPLAPTVFNRVIEKGMEQFSITSDSSTDLRVELEVVTTSSKSVKVLLLERTPGLFSETFMFVKSGVYRVHIRVNGLAAVSYRIEVQKH